MNISEVFIRRPVMTTLLMLGILVAGVIGYRTLPVNNLPRVDFPTITVSASLPGANPETMAATVATPLERQFATIAGIDSINSTSSLGSTSVTIQFNLSRNIDSAAQDVQTAIAAALPLLPPLPQRPSFRKVNPADAPILFLVLSSPTQPLSTVDEYAETVLAQRISMVSGVAQVQVYGAQKYAVRVRVDPDRLAAKGIGIDQVLTAVQQGNARRPTGTLYGDFKLYNVQTNDQLFKAADYRPLIVASNNGAPVRLGDLGTVVDSVENDKVANWSRGGRSIVLAVQRQPDTNTVQVIDDIKKILPAVQAEIPASVKLNVMYDRSVSIRESVQDVEKTLIVTVVLVVLVIFLFLRNFTATIIPSMALPLSLVGTLGGMALLHFSLNDLSLMGLTLCVGFVVDDAIVVLENIVRHMEHGEPAFEAALNGTREVGFTIVSMTTSLVAVFIPILFMGDILGRLFREFAVTITVAILISGFVSLTLTPMLCSRFLKPSPERRSWVFNLLERVFNGALRTYDGMLVIVLRHPMVTLLFSIAILGFTVFLFRICPKGYIPTADTGQLQGSTEAAQDTSFENMVRHQRQLERIVREDPNIENYMSAVGAGGPMGNANTGRLMLFLKPRSERSLSADAIIQELRKKLSRVPGIKVFLNIPPAIRVGGQSSKGLYQVTVQSLDNASLYEASRKLLQSMQDIPGVQDPTSDLQTASLQVWVEVDRDKASSLGITSRAVDAALSSAYGTRQISTIYTPTNEYQVILQVETTFNQAPAQLPRLYVRSSKGRLVPLTAFARIHQAVGPLVVTHLGQMPSATVSFNLVPGASLGTVLDEIRRRAMQAMPQGASVTFQGNAKASEASQQNLMALLVIAIMVIYIVLGILYESFVHPFTILAGLPSAGLGAVLTLMIFHKDLDIYGFLGLIMLLGIVKKNAIMMIDHALEGERGKGLSAQEAIHEACLVRFRPIMMTTMAALMGSLPIAVGLGAGAEARQPLGLAVVGGLMVSQLLTLFITPVFYVYIDSWSGFFRRKRPDPRIAEVTPT